MKRVNWWIVVICSLSLVVLFVLAQLDVTAGSVRDLGRLGGPAGVLGLLFAFAIWRERLIALPRQTKGSQ